MADLKIQSRSARAGLAWVRSGLRLFARQPLAILLLVALGPLVIWSLALVPVVGQAIALILIPAITVGMLAVCRAVDQGTMPGPSAYLDALRDPSTRLRLIQIGVYYAVVVGLLATAFSLLPDESPSGGRPIPAATPATVPRPAPGLESPDREAVPPPAGSSTTPQAAPAAAPAPETPTDLEFTPLRIVAVLASLVVWVPLQMTVWFSPMLVAWHAMPTVKALFFSFFACWRNRAAILVYLFALFGLFVVVLLAFGALVGVLGISTTVAQFVLAPLPLLFLAVVQCANLAMYRDIVDTAGPAPETTEPAPDSPR
jgi:hypothetical protein